MTAWQRLGIEPTDNQREIKKAYAKQLKLIDQDTQPEEFIRLREALEIAQFEAEHLTYENEDSNNLFSIFEENVSFNQQNSNPDDLSNQTLENKLKRLKHHIVIQDINFNIRDELIHFNNEIEVNEDKSISSHFKNQILDLLKENDLDDFYYIFIEKDAENIDKNYQKIIEKEKIEYSVSKSESIQPDTLSIPVILDEVSNALWNKDISDITFDKFNYLLSQQYDIPLSQQIEIKDQLQAPLAEIEIHDLQPEYFRFLELWHETYPDDINQYNPSYYSSLLQEKLNSFLSQYKLLKKLPNEHFELLNKLSGEKKFHPLKMLKLRKSLNKISKNYSTVEIIDKFHLSNTHTNYNYLFLKSLSSFWKFTIINILFITITFLFFNSLIAPDNQIIVNLLITVCISFIYIFILQPILNTKILGHPDYEKILSYYLKYWFLSGFILCSLTPWLPDLLHQHLSYGWFISTIILLSVLLLDATPYMNRLEQSTFINIDKWIINIGLISLSLFLISVFLIIGEPDHTWFIIYSLIPICFLFYPESFRPLFYIFGYNKESTNLADKQIIYRSIGIIFFRLFWIFGFSYLFIKSSSQPFMYAAGLILGSILITGFSAKNLSSTLKYLTYISLCIATLYTIIFPLILIYYLYQSYQAKKIILSS
ncbi:molecular chaperone [Acinetobacter sp. V2]|uniref:molecular chaperone n=1 Tax=Acinetobacter sp. V2 TaxID=1051623 RepID=UPI00061E846F|nr:molecular chaperone [Acinetobacter sp. V2]KKC45390.1 molecular chaperone [Acinetobacter sp. V2]